MYLSQQILFLETADNNLENLFQYNETELTITTEEIPFTMNASTNINLISLGEHCFRFYKNSELQCFKRGTNIFMTLPLNFDINENNIDVILIAKGKTKEIELSLL
ncbi:hypothetical protein ABK040_016168 [Willaertia magna]